MQTLITKKNRYLNINEATILKEIMRSEIEKYKFEIIKIDYNLYAIEIFDINYYDKKSLKFILENMFGCTIYKK